jgi:tRNA A-37 threonylcarbamoyl transferase component Bud32
MQLQGRYTILKEIASGGTATVFLAEDSVLRRKVALKKLHPHLVKQPEMVMRFEKEAVAAASLSHENIIKVYDFGREDSGLFLAMEYVDGISLERLLQDTPGGLPSIVALAVFHQLLEGLAAAHACGICHRDIKPSNVLVDKKGCVRIADFGIAFLSEETSITKTGSYLGTPGYSAPEQALGKTVTTKTDIFSAGTLFYRALTGKLPFEGETPHAVLMAIMERTPPKAAVVNRRVLPGLPELVQEMLAKIPDARPDASACARALERIAMRMGFSLEPARISRLMEDSAGYREAERREISQLLVRQARSADKAGRTHEAVKLFALAEIYSEANGEIRHEAAEFLKDRMTMIRMRRILFAVPFALCLIAAPALLWMRGGKKTGSDGVAYGAPRSGNAVAQVPAPVPPLALAESAAPVRPPDAAAVSPPDRNVVPVSHVRADASDRKRVGMVADSKKGSAEKPPNRESVEVTAVEPVPAIAVDGYLWIKTSPPFAKIRVDGREMGTTPIRSPIAMAPGGHKLELERKGCVSVQTDVHVTGGDTASLRFMLSKAEAGP